MRQEWIILKLQKKKEKMFVRQLPQKTTDGMNI